MSEQYTRQRAEVAMTEAWKQWEGQVVNGEFHLREYLGGAEQGAVFQTVYGVDSQSAALKLVPENSPNAEDRLASWQLALSVSHPTLIQTFQTGHCQIGEARLLYAVMEYAEENLAQIVPQRPLTTNEAREMLQPTLDALAYLHAKGLSHGHIKPANIMAKGDRLKLSTDRLRRAGSAMHDRSDYDPPEATSSPAGDMWSLGMTLVEVLTQRLPVWGGNGQRDPEVPGTLPGPFLDIARHCLRRDPKSRWTALDVADHLKSPVATRVPARPIQRPVQSKDLSKRNPYLIPSVIVLLALASFASWKLLNHSPKGADRITQATAESGPPEKEQPEKQNPIAPPQIAAPVRQVKTPAALEATTTTGGVVHQVLPDVPAKARETIQGAVRVGIKVTVDPSGHVADAAIDSPGPSRYFANLALQASRQWIFTPTSDATRDWTLHFQFSADGTKTSAQPSTR